MTSRRDQSAAALLTVEAAAERLSTSSRFIRRLIAQGADKAITSAIDTHAQAEQAKRSDDEDGSAGVLTSAG